MPAWHPGPSLGLQLRLENLIVPPSYALFLDKPSILGNGRYRMLMKNEV